MAAPPGVLLSLQAKFPTVTVRTGLTFDGKDLQSLSTVLRGLLGQCPVLVGLGLSCRACHDGEHWSGAHGLCGCC